MMFYNTASENAVVDLGFCKNRFESMHALHFIYKCIDAWEILNLLADPWMVVEYC